ncbi:MAG: hypothetical protein DIKNOCCD_03296 [bacterium]|nr:hypothetical protein [bacterium]
MGMVDITVAVIMVDITVAVTMAIIMAAIMGQWLPQLRFIMAAVIIRLMVAAMAHPGASATGIKTPDQTD